MNKVLKKVEDRNIRRVVIPFGIIRSWRLMTSPFRPQYFTGSLERSTIPLSFTTGEIDSLSTVVLVSRRKIENTIVWFTP